MDLSLFHFAQPEWLWALAALPILIAAYAAMLRRRIMPRKLEKFADKHLLPHLIKTPAVAGRSFWRPLVIWPIALALGVVALAGPQWRYTDTQIFKPENDLVILLDMSSSMNVADVKPSRLARAREEISDLLDMNRGLTIGLVAYAAVPHMVVPLTDDMDTIRRLLPSLDTSLITLDGNQLKPALAMASNMLKAEPGHDKSILVISDGDFDENNIADLVRTAGDAKIYTMGMGTAAGAPILLSNGDWAKDKEGRMLIGQLHANRLQELSTIGHGIYVEATYDDNDTNALLSHIGGAVDNEKIAGRNLRVWEEGFYVPVLLLALLLLPLFRKRNFLPILVLFAFVAASPHAAYAAELSDWFRNTAQQGQSEFVQGHYGEAAQKFTDPYQKGVAAYKAGQYDQAAALFKTASEGSVGTEATYNLGNAQLMQGQPEAAIENYQSVLKQKPDDASAKHNLEIAQKLLQQKKQQEQQNKSEQNQGQKQGDSEQNKKGQSGAQNQQQAGQTASKPSDQSNQDQKKSSNNQQDQQNTSQSSGGNQQSSQNQNSQDQSGKNGQKNADQKQSVQPQEKGSQSNAESKENQSPQTDVPAAQPQTVQQQNGQGEKQPDTANEKPTGNPATAVRQPYGKGMQPFQNEAAHSVTRSQYDIDADQWLNHIQSDPGSFLKNQFMIEEEENGKRQEAPQ